MNLYTSDLYMEDVKWVAELDLPWHKMKDTCIFLSGATGMIGSFLVDVILEKNATDALNCKIYALGRNEQKARGRFVKYANDSRLIFVSHDVTYPLIEDDIGDVAYVLHLASNTHPMQYSTDPIGTITTNIVGLQHMLDFAVAHKAKRFVFASSNEIYGENRRDVEWFGESYCGYIDCNTTRAGYPESKRCGEALCQAYKVQKGLDVVVPRLTRTYGPTMQMSDTKAISQFIKKGITGEDIVLKSAGTQYYSYQYVADSVSALFTILLCGENGEAYNVAEERSDIMLKDLAAYIARVSRRKVVFEIPDAIEAAGYSKATKARLDGNKLQKLGWKPKYDIYRGIDRTLAILASLEIENL